MQYPNTTTAAHNSYTVLIDATVDAASSQEIELRNGAVYTVICTKMTGDKATRHIKMMVYDIPTGVWQEAYFSGNQIMLFENNEIASIERIAALVRFDKTITDTPVGLTLGTL